MINKSIFLGILPKNIKLKIATNGADYVNFNLEVITKGYNKNIVDFVPCIAWGHLARNISEAKPRSIVAIEAAFTSYFKTIENSDTTIKKYGFIVKAFNCLSLKEIDETSIFDNVEEFNLPPESNNQFIDSAQMDWEPQEQSNITNKLPK
ncbi:single-stranded DNA-binding protein [Mycoplasma crocodyli]|uniref:Single-stranded DNA-binding protein n=1 Tax=Mycoplasma crocodyli (strain ATCC 51981 / MP145) TaxID=512564 RepID=D5E5Q5_MYCCM|nr:single-stranded DNA-binding protein [Mycoplasma crocodyli]ADE19586.1 single-stranded DNA-binding protein [Mycoplasma crocodyli MP145]